MAGKTTKSNRSGASGAKKSAAKQTAGKRTAQSKKAQPLPVHKPIHREVCAFVCLGFAILTIFGLFGIDAWLINWVCGFARGLMGYGFYILPFVLLLCFVILLLHGGRPVKMRVISAFALVLVIGALVHVFACDISYPWSFSMLGRLYKDGTGSLSGGLFGGFFAVLLSSMLSRIGAAIVLVLLTFVFLLMSLNMTVISLIRAIENRPRPEPLEDEDEEEEPCVDAATALVNKVAYRHIERVERRRAQEYDLPVDDPPLPEAPKKKKTASVPSPDEYLEQKRAARAEQKQTEPVPEKAAAVPDKPAAADSVPEVPPVPAAELPAEPPVPIVEPPVAVHELSGMPELILPDKEEKRPKQATRAEVAEAAVEIAGDLAAQEAQPTAEYRFPPLDLLSSATAGAVDATEEMRANKERLDATLASFGIDAHITNVTRGPSVTRYELELDRGVKLSKVTNLADDIALALGASGVRISAIPDKISIVGIEVPNRLVSTVFLREVIDSPEFRNHKSRVAFAIGKDIGGNRVVGDIAKLPHMLIAGTTGSGKSVCMNSLIVSLLYKAKPDEVKLIMIDPKMVELGVYNGIPHLLIPVVTDPKKAAGALQWAVTEMMRRYRLMADAGVRDLDSYNNLASGRDDMESMPQVVVVIDELADLMLVAAKEVEESICRIAQMGRASGMHLVIATQRPSADVITGLMKANIPSRIAFAVASAMESRIILDTSGAEKLVGKGDMLYAPLGQGKPQRVQGCFITDGEVQAAVDAIKRNTTAQYSDEVMQQIERSASETGSKPAASAGSDAQTGSGYGDELLPAAVEVILETGQASVSMLQRRLKLGYARATRIVDEMEEKGIVGPFEGSKPRQLLITKEEWAAMQGLEPALEPENPPVEEELP